MRKLSLILITISFLLLAFACDDDSTDPQDKTKTGWIVGSATDGYGTILFTSDGGNTWTRQGNPSSIPDNMLLAVKAYNEDHAFVLGQPSDGYPVLLKTSNAGKDWHRMGSSNSMPDIEFSGLCVCSLNEIWLAGFNATILYTKDGGENWTKIEPEIDHPYQFASIRKHGDKIWVCGNHPNYGGIILFSSDEGKTWESQGDKEFLGPPDHHGLIDITSASDTHLWTVGHNRTILHTTDGGKNWTVQKTEEGANLDANGCCAVNEKICWDVEDMGLIFYTSDGGNNWINQETPDLAGAYFLYRVSAISESEAWVVGPSQMPPFDGIILYTSDAGKTWTRQTTNSLSGLNDVSFVGSKH